MQSWHTHWDWPVLPGQVTQDCRPWQSTRHSVCTFCRIDMLDPRSNYESNINKYLITHIWIYSLMWLNQNHHQSESINALSKNETDSNIWARLRPACSSLSRTWKQLFLASFSDFIATTMQCSYKALHISCLILHSNRFHYGTTGQMTLAEKHHNQPWSSLS